MYQLTCKLGTSCSMKCPCTHVISSGSTDPSIRNTNILCTYSSSNANLATMNVYPCSSYMATGSVWSIPFVCSTICLCSMWYGRIFWTTFIQCGWISGDYGCNEFFSIIHYPNNYWSSRNRCLFWTTTNHNWKYPTTMNISSCSMRWLYRCSYASYEL